MRPRHRRLAFIVFGVASLGLAAALVLNALRSNLVFFFSPSQVAAQAAPRSQAFRIGGLVETGSVRRGPDGLSVRFVVTDQVHGIPVSYRGLLPDLFREGKGVVVAGRLAADGSFQATEVLAKHDENYMPPDAKAALEAARQTGKAAP
ncbi:cytochrome c maturation protein CcmE [Ramlibacter solisilvae]|uniref:Cytochrome c-type biogenesis protein CcmE n=1 Tax=Ramlibacter tataouinensis TaxID=94132 RepID=A0A127JYI0_9BURK|nr:cytochrome c maturation protein CcmE [Ramlibacter tataouinensis]AMO25038.1 cytochrome C biogenesis protein CcmE [Ramlibacter tataouinensis]